MEHCINYPVAQTQALLYSAATGVSVAWCCLIGNDSPSLCVVIDPDLAQDCL